MALLTQFMTFFVSPFSEPSSHAELNNFLRSRRIINVEKRLIDGERGTGWIFLVEYSDNDGSKPSYTMSAKIDWRDVLNPSQFAVYDLLRKKTQGNRRKNQNSPLRNLEQRAACAYGAESAKDKRGVHKDKRSERAEIQAVWRRVSGNRKVSHAFRGAGGKRCCG